MDKRLLFLPFAGVVVLAGYLGWQTGQPLSETDVLNHYAGKWVIEGPDGAATTDCYGVPGEIPGVWMIVICEKGPYSRRTPVGDDGNVFIQPTEPQT